MSLPLRPARPPHPLQPAIRAFHLPRRRDPPAGAADCLREVGRARRLRRGACARHPRDGAVRRGTGSTCLHISVYSLPLPPSFPSSSSCSCCSCCCCSERLKVSRPSIADAGGEAAPLVLLGEAGRAFSFAEDAPCSSVAWAECSSGRRAGAGGPGDDSAVRAFIVDALRG